MLTICTALEEKVDQIIADMEEAMYTLARQEGVPLCDLDRNGRKIRRLLIQCLDAEKETLISKAKKLLRKELQDGRPHLREDLRRLARESAIGKSTLERAAAELGVVRDPSGHWSQTVWTLPTPHSVK